MTAAAAPPLILSDETFQLWPSNFIQSRVVVDRAMRPTCPTSTTPDSSKCRVSVSRHLEDAVLGLLASVTPTAVEREVKRRLFNSLAHLLRHTLGHAVGLFIAGSTAYDVDSLKSDMDVVVMAHWAKPREILACIEGTIRATQQSVNAAACEWALSAATLQLVDSAKVPILSIRSPSGIECDVSVNTNNSLRHTEFFKGVLTSHPNLRPIMRLLKHWVKARQLPTMREGGLPSLVWMMLAVHFCDASHARDLVDETNELLDSLVAVGGGSAVSQGGGSSKNDEAGGSSVEDFPDPLAPFRENSEFSCQLCTDSRPQERPASKDISWDAYYRQECPLFWALVAFFGRLASRQHLTRYVSMHATRAKGPAEVEARILGPMSHGGVLDELLTVEDPATSVSQSPSCSSDSRLSKESSEVLRSFTNRDSPYFRHCAINGIPVGVATLESSSSSQQHSPGMQTPSMLSQNDLASRVTSATWLVYQFELLRAHRILGRVIASLSDVCAPPIDELLPTLFKQNQFNQRYKLPSILPVPKPIWQKTGDFVWASSLVSDSSSEGNGGIMIVVVLLEGRLVLVRVEQICNPWGSWWSMSLNRRDARTVLHGTILSPVTFDVGEGRKVAWLAETRASLPLLFKPCNFVMRLSVVSLVDPNHRVALLLTSSELKRLEDLHKLAADAPWHHSKPFRLGTESEFFGSRQPCSAECRVCNVDGLPSVRDAYLELPNGHSFPSTESMRPECLEIARKFVPSVVKSFSTKSGGRLPKLPTPLVARPSSPTDNYCSVPFTVSSDLLPAPSVEKNAAGDELLSEDVLLRLKLEDIDAALGVGASTASLAGGGTLDLISAPAGHPFGVGGVTFGVPVDDGEPRRFPAKDLRNRPESFRPLDKVSNKNKIWPTRRDNFSINRREQRKRPSASYDDDPMCIPQHRTPEPSQRQKFQNAPSTSRSDSSQVESVSGTVPVSQDASPPLDEPSVPNRFSSGAAGRRRKDLPLYVPPACRSDDPGEPAPTESSGLSSEELPSLNRSSSSGQRRQTEERSRRSPNTSERVGGVRIFASALQKIKLDNEEGLVKLQK